MDGQTLTQNGVINAAGASVLTFRTTGRQTWTVGQVSVNAAGVGGGASCAVYLDGALITPLVPQADAAAGDPPILLYPGHSLTVQWSAATVGATTEATIIFDDGA